MTTIYAANRSEGGWQFGGMGRCNTGKPTSLEAKDDTQIDQGVVGGTGQ